MIGCVPRTLALLSLLLPLAAPGSALAAADPVFGLSGPEAGAYGATEGYPLPEVGSPNPAQKNIVALFSHFDQVTSMHTVRRAGEPSVLKRAEREIPLVFHYDAKQKTIGDYLNEHAVTGLLIARDDTILFEHYQYARTDRDRLISNSMAKTITAMLVGIAVSEGKIRSLDDTAATYVPEVAGSEYGATPLRALLHMSSGVTFHETYQPGDDIAKFHGAVLRDHPVGAIAALRQFNARDAAPGTRFAYASPEAEVLGLVVSRAVHMPLADYMSSRIWQKLGAEQDAAWAIDPTGEETSYCCFIATLRDWARFGLMLAHDGAWNGQQIVPRQWIIDATTLPQDSYLHNAIAPHWGYGYLVFLLPGERRMFLLVGTNGQYIFVDPESKLVMVHTGARMSPSYDSKSIEVVALWYALVAQYGRR